MTLGTHNRLALSFALALACVAGANVASAQASDTHTVTITVIERTRLEIIGGDVFIDVTPSGPGTTTVSNSGAGLQWWSNGNQTRYVTVETNLAAPVYSLTVEAQNITELGGKKNSTPGTAVGVVALDGLGAKLFIDAIWRTWSMCDLVYTAQADPTTPVGTDVHTVTYTLVRS